MTGPVVCIPPRPLDPPPTRAEALDTLRALAVGLAVDQAGVERLLERIAGMAEAEELRAALVELGAEALLCGVGPRRSGGGRLTP